MAILGMAMCFVPLFRFGRTKDAKYLVLLFLIATPAAYFLFPFIGSQDVLSKPFMYVSFVPEYGLQTVLFSTAFLLLFMFGFFLVPDSLKQDRRAARLNDRVLPLLMRMSPVTIAVGLSVAVAVKNWRVDEWFTGLPEYTILSQILLLMVPAFLSLLVLRESPSWLRFFAWGVIFPLNYVLSIAMGGAGIWMIENFVLGGAYFFRHRRIPVALMAATFAGSAILYPIRDIFRAEVSYNSARPQASRFADGIYFLELASLAAAESETFGREAADRFDLRFSMAPIIFSRAMSYHLAGDLPYWHGATFWDLPLVYAPRILFPWKPEKRTGQWHGHTYGITTQDDERTSVNLPVIVESFINFGYLGVVLGFFLGALCGIVSRFLGHGRTPVSAFLVIMVFSSLINSESSISLIYGQVLQKVAIIWVALLLFARPAMDTRAAARI